MTYFETRKDEFKVSEKSLIADFPRNGLIELSNGCNHACLFCHNSLMVRKVGKLPIELFRRFLREAVDLGLEEIGIYATGEPFINPELEEFIKESKEIGIKRVYCTSNGALATVDRVRECVRNGLDSIKFSINASSREEYKLVHGSDDWDRVLANVQDISSYARTEGNTLKLFGSCVMTRVTGDISEKHRDIFGGFFDDLSYTFAGNQGGRTLSTVKKISYLDKAKEMRSVKPCEMLWSRIHLTSEGYLTACCVDYENDLVYSDIREESLKDGWNNETMRKLRERHLTRNLAGTVCASCLTGGEYEYEPIDKVLANKTERIDERRADLKRGRLASRVNGWLEERK